MPRHNIGDISSRTVLDLGCGTGCLSIAAVMLEAAQVHAIDLDPSALEIFQQNITEFELNENPEIKIYLGQVDSEGAVTKVQADTEGSNEQEAADEEIDSVPSVSLSEFGNLKEVEVETVLMNPPFGTKNKGIDVAFLKAALSFQPNAIYSLHKSSTRDFLVKKLKTL